MNSAPVPYTISGAKLTISIGTIPSGQTATLMVHLVDANKGKAGFPSNAVSAYYASYSFEAVVYMGYGPCGERAKYLSRWGRQAGDRCGWLSFRHKRKSKGGLFVTVFSGSNPVGTCQLDGQTSDQSCQTGVDGFYFIAVPAGGPYTVKMTNSMGASVGSHQVSAVTSNAFIELDFNSLSPADPAIQGFLHDQTGGSVEGVTAQLLDARGEVLATTTTNRGGYYSFRFFIPGDYTIRIILNPSGYTASKDCRVSPVPDSHH